MSKKETEPFPTVKEMAEKLEKLPSGIDPKELLTDLFECGAIAISNKFDMRQAQTRELKYLNTMAKYDEEIRNLIVELFADIRMLITNQYNSSIGFNDYLGALYMNSGTSNNRAGQFFTPYHISKLCAACGIDVEKVAKAKEKKAVLTLIEPSCGSSGMIIATADILYNNFNFDITQNLFVECSDVDSRCIHMSYIQLGLAGIPAVIYKRDSLTIQTWERWYTPSLLMQWKKFRKFIKQ